jgi:hypothetical protein
MPRKDSLSGTVPCEVLQTIKETCPQSESRRGAGSNDGLKRESNALSDIQK